MRYKIIFGALLLAITLVNCNNNSANPLANSLVEDRKIDKETFDYGAVKNGKYYNRFFNFEIAIPQEWTIQSKEEVKQMAEEGRELLSGDNEQLQEAFEASEITSANLLTAFKHKEGASPEYNASIAIVAENLGGAKEKSGAEYLGAARDILLQANKGFKVDPKFDHKVINGWKFDIMNVSITYEGIEINQQYYFTIKNNFTLTMVCSYSGEQQKAELDRILKTFNYRKK